MTGLPVIRPTRRADCLEGGSNAARPCPWASSCRHGLPESPTASCSLDVATANPDGLKLEEIAVHLGGLSRERIRQIEAEALGKLARLLDADARPTSAPPAASRYPSRPTTQPSESTREPRSKGRGPVRVGEGGHYPSHSETVERPSHAPLGFLDRSA